MALSPTGPASLGRRIVMRIPGMRAATVRAIPLPSNESDPAMSFGMYQASVPAFVKMLNNLSAILDKAEAYAAERKIEPEVLLNWRLAPDMFPLHAADSARVAISPRAPRRGWPASRFRNYADEEKSFAELKARIAKTVKFVEGFAPKDIDGSEERDITLTVGGQDPALQGRALSRAFRCCPISISTPPPPTPSSGAAASRSASAISSARSDGGLPRSRCRSCLGPRNRKAISKPATKPPI